MTEVRGRIQKACERSGRDPRKVTLIAVSKTKPVSMIQEAMLAGQTEFGENRPQELRDKARMLKTAALKWHMIGSLQKNKIKYVLDTDALIHSVDSVALAEEIAKEAQKRAQTAQILLEVNIAEEESKHGFRASEVPAACQSLCEFSGIQIRGLMTVAPYTEQPETNRVYFRKMKQLLIDIKSKNIDNNLMNVLSMGMTSDYEVAIEEGATMVRVGTGIFGERNYP